MKKFVPILSILTLVLLVAVAVRYVNLKWIESQRESVNLANEQLDGDILNAATGDGVTVRQVTLKNLNSVDRCIICHPGSEIESKGENFKTTEIEVPSFEEIFEYAGNAGKGAMLFEGDCAPCHGRNGDYEKGSIGPSLNSRELDALADDHFWYNALILGREGTAMTPWTHLRKEQLSDIIAYLKSFKQNLSTVELVKGRMSGANVENGEKSYRGLCSGCHGKNGDGGIGPSLNSPEFQSVADFDFIARTVISGRTQTAMSSYSYMEPSTLADIISFVKTWQTEPAKTLSVAAISGQEPSGEKIFSRVCSQCHGERGQGGIGPAILGKGFLATASDHFIKEIVSYGRTGTPMRASLLGEQGLVELKEWEINDVVAYIRSYEDRPPLLYGIATVGGTAEVGKKKYARFCEQCHGADGAGGTGPAIGMKGFLDTVSDGFIQSIVMNGRTGTEMKPFSGDEVGGGVVTLSEADVDDIIHYLRVNRAMNAEVLKQPKNP